ncbi:MAG: T9SS type A sorting domain-containing protein [Ignavibacteria bacterium]
MKRKFYISPLLSGIFIFLFFFCSHQITKADPFDIYFGTATYTNGSQTDTFSINCGDIITLSPGGSLTFIVYSSSQSISNTMILSCANLPNGATFPTVIGLTYVESTFNWTPSGPFFGNIVFQLRGTATVDCPVTFDWPLPVELNSFSSVIHGNSVKLNWQTNLETNNSKFIIERLNTGIENNNDWSQVGSVQGNGTTSSPINYTFTDRGLNSGTYQYRLNQKDFNGNFEYHYLNNNVLIGLPEKFELSQNYPNPFNPSTKIDFQLPKDGNVNIKVFDNSGREATQLVNEFKSAGYFTIDFNASSLSSGVYFYKLTSDNIIITKKMLLLK